MQHALLAQLPKPAINAHKASSRLRTANALLHAPMEPSLMDLLALLVIRLAENALPTERTNAPTAQQILTFSKDHAFKPALPVPSPTQASAIHAKLLVLPALMPRHVPHVTRVSCQTLNVLIHALMVTTATPTTNNAWPATQPALNAQVQPSTTAHNATTDSYSKKLLVFQDAFQESTSAKANAWLAVITALSAKTLRLAQLALISSSSATVLVSLPALTAPLEPTDNALAATQPALSAQTQLQHRAQHARLTS
jgi:hypothetical protein